jgi:CubicO group peptidase (beta-lactamase class C family)
MCQGRGAGESAPMSGTPPNQPSSRWSATRAALESGIRQGWHAGAQVSASVDGQSFELAIGEASPGIPLTPDSVGLWLSSCKPLTAVALARLVESGRLSWDDPAMGWIPEFAGGGKESITLRHILTHTGGFRGADRCDPARTWEDSVAFACASELEKDWVIGQTGGYHANGSWFILGEILQRVTGSSFNEWMASEVFTPLGIEAAWFGVGPSARSGIGDRWVAMERTGNAGRSRDPVLNDPLVASRCRPGSGLRGSARELRRFYEGLLHPPPGWLASAAVADLVRPHRHGVFDRTFMAVIDFGLGFILNSDRPGERPAPYGYGPHASPRTFGHSGNQSSCAFADPERDLAVAWLCTGMPGEPAHQQRQRELNAAIYEDLETLGPSAS